MDKTSPIDTPSARRPVRWEDLTHCLAWPLLLKLPGSALRWSRLLVAYVATIPLLILYTSPPRLWTALVESFGARAVEVTLGAFNDVTGQQGTARRPWSVLERLSDEIAKLGPDLIAIDLLMIVGLLAWFGLIATMLARSTALEVARGLDVSPRALAVWGVQHWRSILLWLWPLPFLVVLGIVTALPIAVAAWLQPPFTIGVVLVAIGFALAFVWLLLAIGSIASAPLVPAAVACDDGDSFDALQRTMAITIGKPVRLLLCYAWVLLVAFGMMSIVAWLAIATSRLVFTGGPRITDYMVAVTPIFLLVPAVGISVIGSGLALAYLYLRRIADEQDLSEVPVRG